MHLIELLKSWDTDLLLLINGFHSSFLDGFMFSVSNTKVWIPLYLAVLFVVIKHWKKQSFWIVLALILCCVLADQVASGIIKDLVKRLRPSHAENLKGLLHFVNDYQGGRYGFVSSHAANTIGFALLTTLLFRQKLYAYVIFFWAITVAYSRMYLGVHYPLDILGGDIVGILSALFCYWLIKRFRPQLLASDPKEVRTIIPVVVLGVSFLGMIIYSLVL